MIWKYKSHERMKQTGDCFLCLRCRLEGLEMNNTKRCKFFWTSFGGNTPQNNSCTVTNLPSWKLSKLDEPGHCWRSGDEFISDVLLWTPAHDQARAGRPARIYILQLCEDTGCSPEDLPEAMNN